MEYKREKSGPKSRYSDTFRRMVCEEILAGKIHQAGARKKYSINKGVITGWLRWYEKNHDIVTKPPVMTEQEAQEVEKIKKQAKELEAALAAAELKIVGLETLIDVAEEHLKINIRKKPGTKQSNE